MKRLRRLWDDVTSFDNLLKAAKVTLGQGRRYRSEGARFQFYLEHHVLYLQEQLRNRSYQHGRYRGFTVYEPKERLILAAPIRDRIVHHAVHDVVAPLVDRGFIFDSYACRKGKGTHRALDRAQKFMQSNGFFLHLDVRKFFPSIPLDRLKEVLRRRVREEPLLWLFDLIIDSSVSQRTGKRSQQQELFPQNTEDRGLPIGNLTSQFLANLYLNELDQWVKHTLKCRCYIRYMDDFVLFGNDRQELGRLLVLVRNFCKERLGLSLHEKGGIKRYDEGLGFLGFRIFRTHRRLKGPALKRFLRRARARLRECQGGLLSPNSFNDGIKAWRAHVRYGDTYHLVLHLQERCPMIMTERRKDA